MPNTAQLSSESLLSYMDCDMSAYLSASNIFAFPSIKLICQMTFWNAKSSYTIENL